MYTMSLETKSHDWIYIDSRLRSNSAYCRSCRNLEYSVCNSKGAFRLYATSYDVVLIYLKDCYLSIHTARARRRRTLYGLLCINQDRLD
jgi:hypothetical protein